MRLLIFSILIQLTLSVTPLPAQDPLRFSAEIEQMKSQDISSSGDLIIFTGSSSVRMWKDVADRFPGYHIINRGFGGSQMSDLLYFLDDLVIDAKPCQVFIYEGDNDLSAGKTTSQILNDTKEVLERIWEASPDTDIVLISPKPSVARWNISDKYLHLNQALQELSEQYPNLHFADVWTPALDKDGTVMKDIFLEDNLHMNPKGYAIWEKTIRPFLKDCR